MVDIKQSAFKNRTGHVGSEGDDTARPARLHAGSLKCGGVASAEGHKLAPIEARPYPTQEKKNSSQSFVNAMKVLAALYCRDVHVSPCVRTPC